VVLPRRAGRRSSTFGCRLIASWHPTHGGRRHWPSLRRGRDLGGDDAGEDRASASLVIAPGGPDAGAGIAPRTPTWELGLRRRRPCLDLGLRSPPVRRCLRARRALYLSTHSRARALRPPAGTRHVMRYGARTSAEDRAQLWALAEAARPEGERVVQRIPPRDDGCHALPRPGAGLAGRPASSDRPSGRVPSRDWGGTGGAAATPPFRAGEAAGHAAATRKRVAYRSMAWWDGDRFDEDFAAERHPPRPGLSHPVSYGDAEDVVQEAGIRWQGVDHDSIESPAATSRRS